MKQNGEPIHLQYGEGNIPLAAPTPNTTVLRPQFVPGLPNEAVGFMRAVSSPMGGPPLAERIGPGERLTVVIADGTRALPSDRLLPWLFAALPQIRAEDVTILLGNGTHRANTQAEIEDIVGPEIAAKYTILNHRAEEDDELIEVRQADGHRPALRLNRAYVEADRRIVVGFVEPHFMAGFSGGYKGIFPAVAALDSILYYHRAEAIGHPLSTWGVLEGNPTQAQIQENGSVLPVDFCVNVTLNHRHEITGFFCGDVMQAHLAGCAFAKQTAMVACEQRFPLVITTNSGHPLDQNLYQSVKGMCAAAEVVAPGGEIIVAARCADGFPDHGNFAELLRTHNSAEAMLETIYQPGFHRLDGWQVQKLAQVLQKARVSLLSEMEPDDVRSAHLEPINSIESGVAAALDRLGNDVPVAVLPEGPMTIPYI